MSAYHKTDVAIEITHDEPVSRITSNDWPGVPIANEPMKLENEDTQMLSVRIH